MPLESEFPSNSLNKKPDSAASKEEPKKLEKVVTGKVVQRKKSLGKRFAETFTGEDSTKGVFEYMLLDVAVPEIKYLLAMMVNQGLERKWGLSTSIRPTTSRMGAVGVLGATHVAYNRYTQPTRGVDPRTGPSRRSRATHDFRELVFDSRVEADEVLEGLFTTIGQFGVATVSDLYDLAGISGDHTDLKWGWTSLANQAEVKRVAEGYLLDLPRPDPID